MSSRRFPHLQIAPSEQHTGYTNPRGGPGEPRPPYRERASHGAIIQTKLKEAVEKCADRHAATHVENKGIYLEFTSEPGFDLRIKSLEDKRGGIKLLNVHKVGSKDELTTRATVFIPQSKTSHFLEKATVYLTEDNKPKKDGTSTPKNAALIESITDVRAAILESAFWQDKPERIPDTVPDWVEVWLSTEDTAAIANFRNTCSKLDVTIGDGQIDFPERVVLLILANREQLEALIEHSEYIAEFRAAREVATFFTEQSNEDQTQWVDELLARTSFDNAHDIAVLVLDHGVNNGHRLLEPILDDIDCHSADPTWATNDHNGHGTLMAGTAAYGDIQEQLESISSITIRHSLESAKILPPPPDRTPKKLWGDMTQRGVARAEIQAPTRKRIICMAITSSDEETGGRPTSWSGVVDELASGYLDEKRRLIIISAGNVDGSSDWEHYPTSNYTREVQDPAQAWNALSIGAYTRKTRIVDPMLEGYTSMAEAGDISPFTTTSSTWELRRWPIKPEILFEGGNLSRSPSGSIFDTDDLKMLSTSKDMQDAQFDPFSATSAASAQAAHMAAQIQSAYPDAWPETVRALMVHSASWTPTQLKNHLQGSSKTDYANLLRICGYGVPHIDTALSCASNALSLIAESSIQPFEKHSSVSRYINRDMHLYQLPWPSSVLQDLGALQVKMRITLSYFVEPSPSEVGWQDRYRYASHALRFELNGPGQSREEFVAHINKKAREEDHEKTSGSNDHWTIGEARNVGSIHSDVWTGTAAQLASSSLIAVHPATGWWKERHHLHKFDKETRYSLIVSFELPGQEVDIYTPVAISLGIPTPVEIII